MPPPVSPPSVSLALLTIRSVTAVLFAALSPTVSVEPPLMTIGRPAPLLVEMVDAGYQCALLAPTEVLAAQHARSVRDVLGPLAMAGQLGGADRATRIALLTGSMSAQQKREVRDEIPSGEAGIVIGTHALLQESVEFHRLGMVVVDS